jgi:DNA-binding transcriptional LysR family regulator
MELRHLRYFVAVAEELHFARAAERLYTSQPSVSQQIKQLEHELGVELLERTKTYVKLTPSGQAFLGRARCILADVEQAVESARRIHAGASGKISIGLSTPSLYDSPPGLIRAFRTQWSEVQVSVRVISSDLQAEALLNEEIDVGFLNLSVSEPKLSSIQLSSIPFFIGLPEDHPSASLDEVEISTLAADYFIMSPRERDPDLFDELVRFCRKAGFTPKLSEQSTPYPTILGLIATGGGVAFVPPSLAPMAPPGVCVKKLAGDSPHLRLNLAYRSSDHLPVVQNFLRSVNDRTLRIAD